jgi:hypothetical protein
MTWSDISEYVVHFTRDLESQNAYDNVISILWNQVIEARNPFGIGRPLCPDLESQNVVCFSEVPLHELGRIAQRRKSRYGVGFSKRFARGNGANPIWYVEKNSEYYRALCELMGSDASSSLSPIWQLTPLIDAPGDYNSGSYRFEWEREWRKAGDFRFTENDVAFLIVPSEQHQAARDFFLAHHTDASGPSYLCTLIDPEWSGDDVKRAFGSPLPVTQYGQEH